MYLIELVKSAGVIGAGGAGFPTHAKLGSKAEYILLNAAECEPLLRVDQQLMEIFPDEIIKGLEAAGKLIEADKAIIGIKYKHVKVIEILNERIKSLNLSDYVEVKALKDIYPAGDEQVLVYELTGRVVPEASIPISIGCVVINTETALNIFGALSGKPVTETYITVTGDIPNKVTLKVPIGVPIIDVIRQSGIENLENYAVIDGGPMMGAVLQNIEGYVTKKSKGYVLLKKDHFLIRKKSMTVEQARKVSKSACEQCRMCTDLCPRNLLGHNMQPHKVMRTLAYNLEDVSRLEIVQLCCECNVCELFACPANINPKTVNIYYKKKLMNQNIRIKPEPREYKASQSREYRLLPSKRLIAKLGISGFDSPAPMKNVEFKPEYVKIATSQHIGASAVPIVQVGDYVESGQLIGKIPENSLGAAIHASFSGYVVEIRDEFIVIKVGSNV